METVKDEGAAKLSRTELRKQKLAEYLAAKGRLKPPNPKPYLKDHGAVQKSHASGKGKENAPCTTCIKKDIKTASVLLEKNKDSANTVSKLRTLPRATSTTLEKIPFKATMSQSAPQHSSSGTQSKGTAIFRNTCIKNPQSEPPAHRTVRDHKHLNITKVAQKSATSQDKLSGHKVSYEASVKENPTTAVTKRRLVSGKESSSDKVKFQIKLHTTTRHPATIAGGAQPKTGTTRLTKKTHKDNPSAGTAKSVIAPGEMGIKISLIRCPQVNPGRSQIIQNVLKSQVPRTSNKAECKPANMQKTNPSTTRPRSTCISAFPETQHNVLKPNGNVKNPPLQQRRTTFKLPSKATSQAPAPQTLPRPAKSSSQVKEPVQPKTPKSAFSPGTDGVRTVPLDGKKKLSAAQEERLRKLQEWRESKGITYKRPPMPVRPARRKTSALPPQSYWTTMEQEDEVQHFVCAVDQSLNDCIRLIEQGCPVNHVRDVLSRLPMGQKFAKYWICQVRLLEREGNLDILPTFEEAIRIVREPVDELRSVVFEILKKREAKASSVTRVEMDGDVGIEEECQSNMCTPKPVGALIRGERRGSSVIKYKITATPGGKKSQHVEKPVRFNGSEIRFFTPVRRSARIEKMAPRYPVFLQEHDLCVTSQQDLVKEESESTHEAASPNSPLYVYRENDALKNQVQVQLVYE